MERPHPHPRSRGGLREFRPTLLRPSAAIDNCRLVDGLWWQLHRQKYRRPYVGCRSRPRSCWLPHLLLPRHVSPARRGRAGCGGCHDLYSDEPTYYFAVRAYDTSIPDEESFYSNEVCKDIP